MRLVTRGDLDSLSSAVLIGLHEDLDEILLTHPQRLADGQIEINGDDIIANLPYQPGCAMWFDHHLHTTAATPGAPVPGAFGRAPSAARLVYEFYGGREALPQFEELVWQTDRLDSADLTLDDVLDPQGFIKLGFTLDARSGLDGQLDYFRLLLNLLAGGADVEEVLRHREVEARCARLEEEDVKLHAALQANSTEDGNVLLTDFRDLPRVPVGNRFLVFALFPRINVALRVQREGAQHCVMLTLGHSILNRTCCSNLGELAARYGGGGHRGAASIRLSEPVDWRIKLIVDELRAAG